jgi:GntR family transcriptional regulator / MocR family aminotransferase
MLVPGAAVPPTPVLAAELGISRSVVVDAYDNLAADGYLEARQGSGTRVRPGAPAARPPRHETGRDGLEAFFEAPRRTLQLRAPIRLLGGLPDAALFPRREWVRHYRAALAALPDPELGYPDVRGAEPLRVAMAAYLGRVRGVATAPERLLICAGVTQGLTLVCRALARLGVRRIAIEDPCFGMHREAIAMAGLQPVPVPVEADGLDPARLEAVDVRAVLVAPAHSYPTGAVLDARRRRDLVGWADRRDALIIEDDYDAEFRYDRVPVGALQGLAPERVIYVGSVSKTVTPALRLGWVAAPSGLNDRLEREKHLDDMGSSLLEQLAFARFTESGDLAPFLRRVRPIYRERRNAMIAALAEHVPTARWQGAAAGLHLHVMLPDGVDERAVTFAAFDRGVLVEDAAWHWARPEEAAPSIVLGYGSCSEPMIRRGVALLADALAAA